MEKNKKIALALIILIATITFALIPTFANATINPNDYKPGNIDNSDLQPMTNIVNPIIAVLRYGGIGISIIVLMILGIKYMVGSVSEKAEYKKTMIVYIIGVALLISTTQLLAIIIKVVNGFSSNI